MPQSCNFQTVRDDTKQSDWPLPGKKAPQLHRIKLSPTFYVCYAQNGGLRHNGLPPMKCMGFRITIPTLLCHVFAPLRWNRAAPSRLWCCRLSKNNLHSFVFIGFSVERVFIYKFDNNNFYRDISCRAVVLKVGGAMSQTEKKKNYRRPVTG